MDRKFDELRSVQTIKRAMLQHDHLFKQQVKELHRLYGVQKMLMTDLANRHSVLFTPVLSSSPSFSGANGTYIDQNLTKGRRCSDLKQAAYEEEADIELTLSIGNMKNNNNSITKPRQQPPDYSLDLLLSKSTSDQTDAKLQEECSNTTTSEQPRKRPHWLSKSLSLHET